jgi:hypothetical protein
MLLKTALGPWLRSDLDIWKWFYVPAVDCLLEVKINEILLYNHNTKSVANNIFGPESTEITTFPSLVQKASVEPLKRGLFRLIDTGELSTPQQPSKPHCFHSFLQKPHKYNQWCFDYLHIPSYYEPIIQDIKNGAVWLVSDGSYHPTLQYGTAAWILEGLTTNIKLIGRVITPGQAADLSAYRCKLSGILVAITFINTLTSYHEFHSEITIQCDCVSGLEKAFSHKPPTLKDSCQDLLKAIQLELKNPFVTWKWKHIKGHQDDTVSFAQLDRPSQLNVMVDFIAKDFIKTAMATPRHYEVRSTSWMIKVGTIPLIQNLHQTIYDLVHTTAVKQYWIKKSKTDQSFDSVLWPRLGKALDRMPLQRRLFVSKHTAGMCGVGKFQKLWGKRESNSCPHCGLLETAQHVWTCQDTSVSQIWQQSLTKLQHALNKINTDPDLVTAIMLYLNSWRNNSSLRNITKDTLINLLQLQETIGAQQFFEGWIHTEWEIMQDRYYQIIDSRRSSKRWTIALITKLWEVAWDLWDFRNEVFHHKKNLAVEDDISVLDLQVKQLSNKLSITGLPEKDQHLLDIPLPRLLAFLVYKKWNGSNRRHSPWLTKKRQYLIRRSRQEHLRRYQLMILSMQHSFQNWLTS